MGLIEFPLLIPLLSVSEGGTTSRSAHASAFSPNSFPFSVFSCGSSSPPKFKLIAWAAPPSAITFISTSFAPFPLCAFIAASTFTFNSSSFDIDSTNSSVLRAVTARLQVTNLYTERFQTTTTTANASRETTHIFHWVHSKITTALIVYHPPEAPPRIKGPIAPVDTSAPCARETDTMVVRKMAGKVEAAPAAMPASV